MTRMRKVLMSCLVVGLVATAGGWATYSAFSSTTTNASNQFTAGTVTIGDNDADGFMYNVSAQSPGVTVDRCIRVTYTGSLSSAVKLFATGIEAGGQYIDLTVSPGTSGSAFPDCTGFVADSDGPLYSGTLKGFGDAHTSFATGVADVPLGKTSWDNGDAVVYRFSLTLQDVPAAQGATSGLHSFTWEARNL